jgi:hypothetical protein
MYKINKAQSGVLITVFMTAVLSAMPLQAAIRQQAQPLRTGKNGTYLASSWGGIWNRIRRIKNAGGGRGEPFCPIAPAKLVGSDSPNSRQGVVVEVWSDRPLFLWKGGGIWQFELLLPGSEKPWTPKLSQGETKVIYDGKPLQPGQSYEWRVTGAYPIRQGPFRVMEREKRDRIAKELTALEEQLKKQRASAERIALEKANYFAERGLWPDALRELYSVPKPSAQLRNAIAQIQAHDFCAQDKPNVPASR